LAGTIIAVLRLARWSFGQGAAVNLNRPLAASFVNTRFFHTTVERPARSTVEARNR
jgi:hypothetical protein